MVSCIVSRAIGAMSVAVACFTLGCSERPGPLRPGEQLALNVIDSGRESGADLLWIVTAADCFSCSSPLYAIRQLLLRDTVGVRLRVLLVDGDSADVRALMTRERLGGRLYQVAQRDPIHTLIQERLAVPAVVTVVNGTVTGVWTTPRQLRTLQADTLLTRVQRAFVAR